jgi:Ca2+-binding RTX toxin-like protein
MVNPIDFVHLPKQLSFIIKNQSGHDSILSGGINNCKTPLKVSCIAILLIGVAVPSLPLIPISAAAEVDADITIGASSKTTDAFALNPIEIEVGETVRWTNRDSQPHTVTSGSNGQPDGKFDSSPNFNPLLAPGEPFSHTFEQEGEYPYFCGLHPNMVGTVIVGDISDAIDISVHTLEAVYETGDTITIYGNVTVHGGTVTNPLLIQVLDPNGDRDRIDQVEVDGNGSFYYEFIGGALMNTDGVYQVKISYLTTTAATHFEFFVSGPDDQQVFCGRELEDFDNVIVGTSANDVINGTTLDDLIRGLPGNDTIDGKGGNDCLAAYGGNDILRGGPGNDSIYGGDGDDELYGNDGNDVLYGNFGYDLLSGGSGDDYLAGKHGDDKLFGNDGNDKMFGNEGNDFLKGGDANDIIFGGFGNDDLSGNLGDDRLSGQEGNDHVKGQRGDDRLDGGEGSDLLDGGRNSDRCTDTIFDAFLNCEEQKKLFSERITVDISLDDVDDSYEPGDELAIEGQIAALLDNKDLTIRVMDPAGSTQLTENVPNPIEIFDLLYEIPGDAEDGVWTFEVEYDDEFAYTYFIVDETDDTIVLVLDNSDSIYEAGDEVMVMGQVDSPDVNADIVEITVLDPKNEVIIDGFKVDLVGDEFEFSFDLANNASQGRYAIIVIYGFEDQQGNMLFEVT